MNINRDNYESYFIDFLDGTLAPDAVDGLLDFLSANPDLANELKDMERMVLAPADLDEFPIEALLKTELDCQPNFDDACIQYMEGDMQPEKQIEFEAFVAKKPEKQRELKLFLATKLKPNLNETFGNLYTLKRYPFAQTVGVALAVAASIVLLVGLWFSIPSSIPEVSVEMAQVLPDTLGESQNATNADDDHKADTQKMATELKPLRQKAEQPVYAQTTPTSVQTKEKQPVENRNTVEKARLNEPIAFMSSFDVEPLAIANSELALTEIDIPTYSAVRMRLLTPEQALARELAKVNLGKVDLGKVAFSSLKSLTNDKFDFQTDASGKISSIGYNSRLIGFTIPFN
jgi:hypothetical protein